MVGVRGCELPEGRAHGMDIGESARKHSFNKIEFVCGDACLKENLGLIICWHVSLPYRLFLERIPKTSTCLVAL